MASAVSYEQAEDALKLRLSQGALAHSRRVAEAAGGLAEHYGVDTEAARLAGLLHDWDKDLSHEALLSQARALGIELTDVDARVPYLLHARTGAASASLALPGLGQDVVDAIACHTVGGVGMSDLDRVVYIADMLEPGRKHAPLEPLREAAGTVSLDELFRMAYAASLRYLIDRGKLIHPTTVDVWNWLVAEAQ